MLAVVLLLQQAVVKGDLDSLGSALQLFFILRSWHFLSSHGICAKAIFEPCTIPLVSRVLVLCYLLNSNFILVHVIAKATSCGHNLVGILYLWNSSGTEEIPNGIRI